MVSDKAGSSSQQVGIRQFHSTEVPEDSIPEPRTHLKYGSAAWSTIAGVFCRPNALPSASAHCGYNGVNVYQENGEVEANRKEKIQKIEC